MAAAVTIAHRQRFRHDDTEESLPTPKLVENENLKDFLNEPISFHLRQQFGTELPPELEGMSSVQYLRMHFEDSCQRRNEKMSSKLFKLRPENRAGVTMEAWIDKLKVTYDKETIEWQKRLLIITTKRIFIIIQKNTNHFLEIVDSIPLQEITSIRILAEGNSPQMRTERRSLARMFDSSDWSTSSKKKSALGLQDGKHKSMGQALEDHFDHLLSPTSRGEDRILKIATLPGGFNGGQPYYFTRARDIRRPARNAVETRLKRASTPPANIAALEEEVLRVSQARR